MHKAFISSRQGEMKDLRKLAVRPCMRNGIDPFFFEWDVAPAEEIVEYLSKRIRECSLFVGIYGTEYGKPSIPSPESADELVSPIEFELQMALRHIGQENVLLFTREARQREPALEQLIGTRVNKTFGTENEFALSLDESIKEWNKWRELKRRSVVPDELLVSVESNSPDRPAILSAIYRGLFSLGGNVIRARQTVHLGSANVKVLVQWENKAIFAGEDSVKDSVRQELSSLYSGDAIRAVSVQAVRVRSREGEVKSKGNFSIQFFDAPGIAERLFAVFASDSISILESNLEQVSNSPPIGAFEISANVTHISRKRIGAVADRLRSLAGVFSVKEHIELGSWWY